MEAFQTSFGVPEMKYSIHLVSHIWLALQLYGPLHIVSIVSCYGPKDQIGKITRKIVTGNNITKNIMNNTLITRECTILLESCRLAPDFTDHRVLGEIRSAFGIRSGVFVKTNEHGCCRMLGKATSLVDVQLFRQLLTSRGNSRSFKMDQVMMFKRAYIETGIFVRTEAKQSSTKRNESLLITSNGVILEIDCLIAIVYKRQSRVTHTLVRGVKFKQITPAIDYVGTESAAVPHMFAITASDFVFTTNTSDVVKQLVILRDESNVLLVSPPSNRFRPTWSLDAKFFARC